MSDYEEMLFRKYRQNGIDSLSDTEVLSLILSYTSVKNVKNISESLIRDFGCANSVFNADINHIAGTYMSEKDAVLIKLVTAVSMKCILNKCQNFYLNNPNDIKCYFRSLYAGINDERLYLISVNRNKMVKGEHLISIGSLDSIRISKEKIIKYALSINAYGFFISHNHPTAGAEPSDVDYEFTKFVVESIRKYNIKIFDHVITGVSSIVSMKELKCGIVFD